MNENCETWMCGMKERTDLRVSGYRNAPLGIYAMVCISCLCFVPSITVGQTTDSTGEAIETTRSALEQWVETQRITSKEKQDLTLAKEVLNARIELVQRQIESLQEKIEEAETNIAETDKNRNAMLVENEKLKESSTALGDTLFALETRTKQLLQRLPDPIRDRVKPLSQRISDATDETKLSVAERFQNVVGILNEVDKFNRDITVNSEVRSLPDGTSAEVTALYLGIGQGYYVGMNGTIAGIGMATEAGWDWKPANDAAEPISQAIAVLKNERPATFIQLPIEIQ